MVLRANKHEPGIGGHISTFASAATLYEVGFNHFFRAGSRRRSRRRVLPGARGARHLLARVSRRAPHRKAARQLPPRARARRRPVVVSASVADARLLGISHGVDGARPDHGDLPGAVHPLPGRSRAEEAVELESVGVSRRRRDRRARIARRHHAARAREARQPHLRRQLQPAAARRSGARQRPDHSGARGGVPRRGLERHQGDLGQRLGSAARERQRRPARQADGRGCRRRVSEVHRRVRRVPAQAFLGQVPAAARDGQAPLRRRAEEADAGRARSGQGLQRLQGGGRAQGAADRPADSHHQRLRARRRGRGEEHHPSAEEADRRRAARRSRALQHSGSRRKAQRGAVLPARRQEPRSLVPERAPQGARRLAADSATARRPRCPRRRIRKSSKSSARAPNGAPPRRRWCSCGCCRSCCATRTSARWSCRSCPTKRARSAWNRCSAQVGIYSHVGQLYEPVDMDTLLYYKESTDGQILEEGINEAGSLASFIAAGTAYSTHGVNTIPFFIYYSMFGFQRVGDLIWAAADSRAPRLPAWRHGRTHDAGRRRAAASGRQQPRARVPGAELRVLRSGVRLRAGGHHRRRHQADVCRSGEHLLLPHGDERATTRCRRCPRAPTSRAAS